MNTLLAGITGTAAIFGSGIWNQLAQLPFFGGAQPHASTTELASSTPREGFRLPDFLGKRASTTSTSTPSEGRPALPAFLRFLMKEQAGTPQGSTTPDTGRPPLGAFLRFFEKGDRPRAASSTAATSTPPVQRPNLPPIVRKALEEHRQSSTTASTTGERRLPPPPPFKNGSTTDMGPGHPMGSSTAPHPVLDSIRKGVLDRMETRLDQRGTKNEIGPVQGSAQ